MRKQWIIFVWFSVGLLGATREAFAYIDPGTGSMILQLLLAAFFGALFTIKQWWGGFIGLFNKKKNK